MDAPTSLIPERTPAGDLVSATPFLRPSPKDFIAEFLPDDRLSTLVDALIEHHDAFTSLSDLTIRTLWQKDAGKEDGRLKLGSISQQTNMTRYLTGVDYVIIVSLKAAAQYDLTNWQMEALLFHQLMHIEAEEGDDGEIKLKKRPHDIGLFNAEIINYGAWYLDLANTSNAFRQQLLWEESGDRYAPAAIAPNAVGAGPMSAVERVDAPVTITSPTAIHTIAPRTRSVDGEVFERDELGRYVNRETGECLDPAIVPMASMGGR